MYMLNRMSESSFWMLETFSQKNEISVLYNIGSAWRILFVLFQIRSPIDYPYQYIKRYVFAFKNRGRWPNVLQLPLIKKQQFFLLFCVLYNNKFHNNKVSHMKLKQNWRNKRSFTVPARHTCTYPKCRSMNGSRLIPIFCNLLLIFKIKLFIKIRFFRTRRKKFCRW